MSDNEIRIPTQSIILLSVILFIGQLSFSYALDFYRKPDAILTLVSAVDFILTCLLVYPFLASKKISNGVVSAVNRIFSHRKTLLILFIFVAMYELKSAYTSYEYLISGFNREGMLNEISAGYLTMLLPSVITMMFVYSFFFKSSKSLKILLGISFFAAMFVYLSRSNLLFLLLVYVLVVGVVGGGYRFKILSKVIFFLVIAVSFATYIGILQGRYESFEESFLGVLEALFRYRAYSIFLAEKAISTSSNGMDFVLFPFFGFFYEKIISIAFSLDSPVSVKGSTFVSDFVYVGRYYKANVLYPWWSWFYGVFGLLGIFLKFIFCYLILRVICYFKLPLTYTYFMYVLLFVSTVKHPFINAASFYSLVSLIIFDILFLKIKLKFTWTGVDTYAQKNKCYNDLLQFRGNSKANN